MASVEDSNGIHSLERNQVKDRKKSTAAQLGEFAKLDNSSYVANDTVEEIDNYKMKVLEG